MTHLITISSPFFHSFSLLQRNKSIFKKIRKFYGEKRENSGAIFFIFFLKKFSKIYFLDEDKIKNKMTARLRSKNERMMLDLLDQIKNLPTDLSSDEFDSLQVII